MPAGPRSGEAKARTIVSAGLAGLACAGIHSVRSLLRLDDVTVTSNHLVFPAWGVGFTFLLATLGTFSFLHSRGRWGVVFAVLVATGSGPPP